MSCVQGFRALEGQVADFDSPKGFGCLRWRKKYISPPFGEDPKPQRLYYMPFLQPSIATPALPINDANGST